MSEIKANPSYKEILRLAGMLMASEISHQLEQHLDGWHIYYPGKEGHVVCSVIEFTGSYGYRKDLLEIQGLLNKAERKYDTVVGFLSADKVYARIEADWERRKKRVRVL